MKNNLLKIAVCIILLIAPSLALSAPASDARIAELERTIQNLQQRVDALKARSVQTDAVTRKTSIKPGNSHDIQNWRQLRKGMSERDVEHLLGSPEKVIVNNYSTRWYYNYQLDGEVSFNGGSGKVETWREP
jgi:outer membrane protein assembly factor BamE (lipoprotein component of BamABCDE complex)